MADGGFRIVPLVCGRCAARMTAGKEQVVYQCGGCGSMWELAEGRLVPREVVHFSGSGDIFLPFWYASFIINSPDGLVDDTMSYMKMCGSVKTAVASTEAPFVFIPAFLLPPPQSIRLGRNMTVRFPSLQRSPVRDLPVEPITVAEVDVPALAELILLSTLVEERRNNPSFLVSFSVDLSGVRLVSVSFKREGNRMIQPEMNLEV
ncbi:MAG: hypothetical protein PHH91_03330 [Desulfuromonadaceae bacterium]|nr:hypothetical protein [Desulfuromonadaceae bacterium]